MSHGALIRHSPPEPGLIGRRFLAITDEANSAWRQRGRLQINLACFMVIGEGRGGGRVGGEGTGGGWRSMV